MTTKQDKKPVPFIKASGLIKKELKDVFIFNGIALSNHNDACIKCAWQLFIDNKKRGINFAKANQKKIIKLASRFEREFLRGEIYKDNNDSCYMTVFYDGNQNVQQFLSSFDNNTSFKGYIHVSAINAIKKDFAENYDDEDMINMFNKGSGLYSFSVTYFEGQFGEYSMCEIAPCWELDLVDFISC